MHTSKTSQYTIWAPPPDDETTLDDVLIYLGEFGRYQKYLICALMVFCLFLTFVYFTQTFLVVVPMEYWCKLPKVEGVSTEKLKDLMIPNASHVPHEGHQLPYSRCWIYDVPMEKILAAKEPEASWPMKKCEDWEYKISIGDVPYMSVAAEENWVCDYAYKGTLAQSIFFVGSIIGGLLFGWMADKYGRVPVLVGTNMMGFIGGISTVYTSRYWQFCLCRFIVGLAYDNIFVIAYILVLEYVGPKWRTFTAGISYGCFYTLGGMTLPWLAYGIADWRTFAMITSVPLASVVAAPFLIPESVRWLISRGHIERAVKIITKIEETNGVKVPQDVYEDFLDGCLKTADVLVAEEHTLADLFRTRRLRRITILLTISWGVIQMIYDGHIRSLDTLGLDVFTTFTIASATEFPAVALLTYILDVLGRRWTLCGAAFLSGIFSLFAANVSAGVSYASFAICGRFFINMASNIAMQYGAELLPTVVRGEGLAFVHVTGYVTSILSPFIAFSSRIMYNLPMIILGTSSVFVSVLCLFLPETLMEQLPQTLLVYRKVLSDIVRTIVQQDPFLTTSEIAEKLNSTQQTISDHSRKLGLDGELFGIDQSFWDTPFSRKPPPDPKGHYLHAKRPASRPGIMRSSMVSGNLGSERRLSAIRERANQMNITSSENSPLDYVQAARKRSIVTGNDSSARDRQRTLKLDVDTATATS